MSSRGVCSILKLVVFIIVSYAMLLCMCYVLMLFTCACDDRSTTSHHWENTIKGGFQFLVYHREC